MSPMRILLVEDEPDLVRAMRKGLTENSYAVDIATNGRDALEQATTNPYDAIVLDVMIPPPDGFERGHTVSGTACTPVVNDVSWAAPTTVDSSTRTNDSMPSGDT